MDKILFEQLKRVPLFSEISEKDLSLIYQKLEPVHFKKGSVIIREGDLGDCFYIIKSGSVRVETHAEDVDHPIILARLEDGDYFGEMALITGEPRSATVVAETDVEVWRLRKYEFDQLILKNPNITLTLTHMLTHRLMKTNQALQETEIQFLKKIHPRGDLKDFGLIRILNFAEQNALTGRIILKQNNKKAIFEYEKGQLLHLDYEDKQEDEALDELLNWEEGTFFIEPRLFDLDSHPISENPDWSKEESRIFNAIERYLLEKFSDLIQSAGSKNLQSALNRAQHKLRSIFDEIETINIQILPEIKIDLSQIKKFNEKYILLFALLLNQILKNLSRDVIGLDFFEIRSNQPEIDEVLEQQQFYMLFEHSDDLV